MTYVKYLSIKLLKEEDCLFLDYIYIVTLVKHSSRDWTHTVFYLVFVYWFNALFIKRKCIRSGVSQSGFAFAHRNINPSERGSGSRVVSRCDGEVAIFGQWKCWTEAMPNRRTQGESNCSCSHADPRSVGRICSFFLFTPSPRLSVIFTHHSVRVVQI